MHLRYILPVLRDTLPADYRTRFVTLEEVAALFGVHIRTVRRWIVDWLHDEQRVVRVCWATYWSNNQLQAKLLVHIADVLVEATRDGWNISEKVEREVLSALDVADWPPIHAGAPRRVGRPRGAVRSATRSGSDEGTRAGATGAAKGGPRR